MANLYAGPPFKKMFNVDSKLRIVSRKEYVTITFSKSEFRIL